MRIAMLDDERRENENLCSLIEAYSRKQGYEIVCEKFTSGRALLERERFDLYFLDYVMDEMDGVEVGQALNEKFGGAVTICYLTGMEAAASEIINAEIGASGFLKKPVSPELLYKKIDRYYADSFSGRLQLRKNRMKETVYVREILYVEAANKQVRVHFENGKEEEYSHSFSDAERLLAPYKEFIRIHRSYIINMRRVRSFDSKTVTMADGAVLTLKIRKFGDIYRDFIFADTGV